MKNYAKYIPGFTVKRVTKSQGRYLVKIFGNIFA
jgi:hypothetical protein